jgi:hypothetical protein
MFKKKDGTEVDEAAEGSAPKLDEAAYEDSWYRSLKAMAETLGVEQPDNDAEPDPEA